MAALADLEGTKLYIKIGDGVSPETFAHPCLINGRRAIAFASDTLKDIVPDCDNPDDPAWQKVQKDGLRATITGAGILDTGSIATYDTFFRSDVAKNVRVYLGTIGYWQGHFKLGQWEITGERKRKATTQLTMESDGAVAAWHAGA